MYAMILLSGCTQMHDAGGAGAIPEPPDTVTTPKGAVFLRADLWDPAVRERTRKLSAASLLPGASIEEIAEGQRGVMQHANGSIYIAEELNYELAREIQEEEKYELEDPALITEFEDGAVVGRNIIGSDDRNNVSSSTGGWQAAVMFSSHGCSGTRIGELTAVTAAHCLFKTIDGNGWYCRDGDVTPDPETPCEGYIYPHWRFGVDGAAGHSNWVNGVAGFEGWPICATVTIPQAFIDATALGWTTARHDYAVVDLSSCPASTWPNGYVAFGTSVLNDTQLASMTAFAAGYPFLFSCMNGSNGASNAFPAGDCIGGTQQYGGGGVRPILSAELFVSTSSDITAGSSQSAYTIGSKADVTQGQSGGPLFAFDVIVGPQLVGILSQGTPTLNRYRRWTNSLHNWVADHSWFPFD
jgi:hypothetical protein